MVGSLTKKLNDKIGKVSVIIIWAFLLFGILWGMIYFCGSRFIHIFQIIKYEDWTLISAVCALVLTATSFSYANKEKKLRDCVGTISLRIIAIIMVTFLLLLVTSIFVPWFKIPGILLISLIIIIAGSGFLRNRKIKKKQLHIKTNKIKGSKKIIFISDLHVDFIYGERHIQKIVNLIKKEHPDFVLIWGDLINSPKYNYTGWFSHFKEIDAPKYAVIGNHDVFFGPSTQVFDDICKAGEITPLRNESIIKNDTQITGIDDKDLWGEETLQDILKKSKIQDTNTFNIFLTHRPIHLSNVASYPIDLELAGHTHNGQIRGLHFLARILNQGYSYGKYTWKEKIAFVSQWLGAGIPFRIGTVGEIVVINIKGE